jgi:hypothetical protein
VTGMAKGVLIELDPPRRQPPKRILLYLPKSRQPVESVKRVEVVVRPEQKKRWDFPTIVQLYSAQAVPLFQQKPTR